MAKAREASLAGSRFTPGQFASEVGKGAAFETLRMATFIPAGIVAEAAGIGASPVLLTLSGVSSVKQQQEDVRMAQGQVDLRVLQTTAVDSAAYRVAETRLRTNFRMSEAQLNAARTAEGGVALPSSLNPSWRLLGVAPAELPVDLPTAQMIHLNANLNERDAQDVLHNPSVSQLRVADGRTTIDATDPIVRGWAQVRLAQREHVSTAQLSALHGG
ncbi:MAG: hypothetical protein AAB289_01745, partial [Chloroflexota bacterium]